MIGYFGKVSTGIMVESKSQYVAGLVFEEALVDVVIDVVTGPGNLLDVTKTSANIRKGVEAFDRSQIEAPRPKIIVLSGSSRFCDVMAVVAWVLERDEHAITMGLHLLPSWYTDAKSHLAEAEGAAEAFDALHLRKIELADEVFCVDFGDYIGRSTRREIEHAVALGKPIRYYTQDPVGAVVGDILRKAQLRAEAKEG